MLALSLAALAVLQPAATATESTRTLRYSIRADPSVAASVNRVLAEIGQPVRSRVSSTAEPSSAIAKRCGGLASPSILAVESEPARNLTTVVHEPCLAFREYRDFVVRPGYTIEDLALASGLRPSSIESARVQKKGGAEWKRADPKLIAPGDKVRFSTVPSWTRVQVDASRVPDRDALVRLIANGLGCAGEAPTECIARRGIEVADDNAAASVPRGPLAATVAPLLGPRPGYAIPSDAIAMPVAGAVAVAMASPPAQPATATATVGLTDAIRESAPVAADQWPYDRALVAAILSQSQTTAREVIIGVADAGLGKADGSPLPAWIFSKNAREEDPEPDGNDDDENTFIDDIVGAGVARADTEDPNGDVGVCRPTGSIDTLAGEMRLIADHGAIVSSIATGLDIHRQATLSVGLPRLVFFRLLDDLCRSPARLQVTESGFLKAMDYVFERAPVLVLSYTISGELTKDFVPSVRRHLDNLDKLLIIPAGNDHPGDLEESPRCPACLANASNGYTASRTLVVGTALPDLTIAPFSNWGRNLVRLFAPGEPSIAVDIFGRPANSHGPATSWSAPYAGLAAGIVQSLGPPYMSMRDIRERLIASSWRLRDPDGKTDPKTSGILNLTAAAALRHTAIEVVEQNAGGQYERRTYVGRMDETLAQLCPEGGLGPVHAMRFGRLDAGRRQAIVKSKTFDELASRFRTLSTHCTLPETIHFTDLVRGSRTFESAALTQVVFPWR